MHRDTLDRAERLALLALGIVLLVTAAWWALALWPTPGTTPEWLSRARAVCFNAGPDGMPDVSGWILLIGQPMGMLGFLLFIWPRELVGGVGWLARRPTGRLALATSVVLVLAGLVGSGARVASATRAAAPAVLPPGMAAADHPRQDREAPELGLVDHRGDEVGLADLEGRPVLLTFAFGHCGDICPLVVDNARRARDEAWGPEGGALVVVTLDPWRDTPNQLPKLAERWQLGEGDHLLGGEVETVEAVLDAWNVARDRNPLTGDIAHPPLLYVLDETGKIAFVTLSGRETIVGLAERL